MIISPVKEGFKVTQGFWVNKEYYKQWGFEWHDWIDIWTPVWTDLYSPIDWAIEIKRQWTKGYWLCLVVTELWTFNSSRQCLMAHLDDIIVEEWEIVKAGQLIWTTWNSWNSTWPHLHFSFRRINSHWKPINYYNGFKGRENIYWKGWINQHLPSKY